MAEVTLESLATALARLEAKLDAATGGGRITLAFLQEQQARLLEEQGRQRDDMAVLLAIMQRLDGTVQGLVSEVRAQHARQDRQARDLRGLLERVGRLESPEPA